MKIPCKLLPPLLLAVAFMVLSAQGARALVITGTSRGFGLSTLLTLSNPLTGDTFIDISPFPRSTGTAPAPYFTNGLFPSGGGIGSFLIGALGNAGQLGSDASSDVDGLPGARFALAHGSAHAFSLGLDSLLSLNIDGLIGNAEVSGDFGALTGTMSTTVSGIALTVLGSVIPILGADLSTPNFAVAPTLLGPLGVSIVLDEQTTTGNGISFLDVRDTAVDITFANFIVPPLGVLNGSIKLGDAYAALTARTAGNGGPPLTAPEPRLSWLLVTAVFATTAAAAWLRRRGG
jgi:hypothetical protein